MTGLEFLSADRFLTIYCACGAVVNRVRKRILDPLLDGNKIAACGFYRLRAVIMQKISEGSGR